MRVLDGLSLYDMAKRKARSRQTSKDSPTDDADVSNANKCVHVSKAINLPAVQKAVKQKPYQGHCQDCVKDELNTNNMDDSGTGGTLWLCLQCAHQGCGRESPHQHALRHHQTPRSTSHCIVINLQNWSCWCYDCDAEILAENSVSVQRAVDWLQKSTAIRKEPCAASDAKETSSGSSKKAADLHFVDGSNGAKVNGASSASCSPIVPKVKGLNNLGNTCFMNAVLQSLCQTHLLEYALNELTKKDAKFVLPGFRHDDDEEDELQELENGTGDADRSDDRASDLRLLTYLEPLAAPVCTLGELTTALHSLVTDMNAAAKGSVINPQSLFSRVCKKAPKFKGNQQHDSHELLVSLLDGVREEEIANRKRSIIKLFNISDPASIDDERKARLKAYGVQLKHTFVDSIFGGHVLDSIVCKECGHASQRFESFLHISLPIVENKELDACTRFNWDAASLTAKRSTCSAKDEALARDSSDVVPSRLSKHQRKVQKQQAKKERRNKKTAPIAVQTLCAEAITVDTSSTAAGTVDKERDDERSSNSSSPEAIEIVDIDLEEPPSNEPASAAPEVAACMTMLPGGNSNDSGIADEPDSLLSVGELDEMVDSIKLAPNEQRAADADSSFVGLSTDVQCHAASAVSPDAANTIVEAEYRTVEALASNLQSLCLGANCDVQANDSLNSQSVCLGGHCAPQANDSSDCQTLCDDVNCGSQAADRPSLPVADSAAAVTVACSTVSEVEVCVNTDLAVLLLPCSDAIAALHEAPTRVDSSAECDAIIGSGSETITSASLHAMPHEVAAFVDSSSECAAITAGGSGTAADASSTFTRSLSSKADKEAAAVKQSLIALAPCQQVHRARTLLACLERYFASEYLTGANKWQCGSCNKRKHRETEREEACRGASGGNKENIYTEAVKKVLIFTPPAVLTLHLKRFEQVGFGARKVDSHVEFPVLLDLAPFCSSLCTGVDAGQLQQQHLPPKVHYALYAVVEHSGSMHWGHYAAFVRARCPPGSTDAFAASQNKFMQSALVDYAQPLRTLVERMMTVFGHNDDAGPRLSSASDGGDDIGTQQQRPGAANAMSGSGGSSSSSPYFGRWYYISDSSVREVTEADVMTCQAYILFYERIE